MAVYRKPEGQIELKGVSTACPEPARAQTGFLRLTPNPRLQNAETEGPARER